MYAAADNMSSFTGVLVRRQYKPGQKYIQLLFKTPHGVKLALTRDPQMVGSLTEGRIYNVEGQEYSLGDKKAVQDPTVALIKASKISKKRVLAVVTAAILVVIGIAYTLFPAKHSAASNNNQTQTKKIDNQPKQTPEITNEPSPGATTEEPGPTAENQPSTSQVSSPRVQTQKTPAVVTSPAPAPSPPSVPQQVETVDNGTNTTADTTGTTTDTTPTQTPDQSTDPTNPNPSP
jgi:hypothetical protein